MKVYKIILLIFLFVSACAPFTEEQAAPTTLAVTATAQLTETLESTSTPTETITPTVTFLPPSNCHQLSPLPRHLPSRP
jgi:PBP1b-binding outer membrane lipoprotein LpoB